MREGVLISPIGASVFARFKEKSAKAARLGM
jgi:hypothetical protein